MPIEPKGTRPISTLRPGEPLAGERAHADADREHREQQRHHVLVAAQHVARERRERREEDRAEEPQPRDAEERVEHRAVARRDASGCATSPMNGFQLIASAGSGAGEAGMNCARDAPDDARARGSRTATSRRRPAPVFTRIPPAIVPSRIATNVPISTRPLPPVSSVSFEVLRQVGVLHRAEERRVQAHEEHADVEQRRAVVQRTRAPRSP